MSGRHTLIYSEQCPNCVRFMDALKRTSMAAHVALVDVSRLTREQAASVTAVPALVTPEGQSLYGTKAFEWLKQFEGDVELEVFGGNGSLAFSDLGGIGYAAYAEGYSPFEPPTD